MEQVTGGGPCQPPSLLRYLSIHAPSEQKKVRHVAGSFPSSGAGEEL